MISLTCIDGEVVCFAETKGYGVYLDSDSLGELAKGCPLRRRRFIELLRRGGTLLFSITNAVELAGPQGASAERIRDFLDCVGPHWIPIELNPWEVVRREEKGLGGMAPVSEEFMLAFFQDRSYELSPGGEKILDISSEHFFRLSSVLEWAQKYRVKIMEPWVAFDKQHEIRIAGFRAKYEQDHRSLDLNLPPIRYDQRWPAKYVMVHLQRLLIQEWKSYKFKAHDGRDFFHAVLATSYASLGTLDKQWKRRVENIPKPNCLAKIYYRPEIDQLVSELESLVTAREEKGRGC